MNNKKKILIVIVSIILTAFTVFSAAIVYAWYANVPRVYTSDQDTGNIARIGMRINLLFERLRPSGFSGTITYSDGVTATFDSTAEWGTKDNPYIISLPRHMVNLYALQRVGYFRERYISKNYDSNGDYIQDSSVMPYFLICDPEDGSAICVDGNQNGTNIEIQPIGNDEYPFIGTIGGAQGTGSPAEAPNGKTSISSIIANFDVVSKPGDVDVGLFGIIGYLGNEGIEGTTFNGAISYVHDLLLYDVKIISKNTGVFEQIADHLFANGFAGSTIRYEEDHHVGILAGHVEYASITNISVYYSDDAILAINVDDNDGESRANYLSDSGIIGLVYNLNPEVNGNSIGSASGTTIAGSVEGFGEEWGGSIDMKTMFNRLRSTYSEAAPTIISRTTGGATHYLCVGANASLFDSTTASDAAHWSSNRGVLFTTIDGNRYYLSRSGTNLVLVTSEDSATSWSKGNNDNYLYNGNYYVSYRAGYGTNGWYAPGSTNYRASTSVTTNNLQTYVSAETVIIDEINGTTSTQPTATANYGNVVSSDGTSDIVYYQSENGGSFVFAERRDEYKTSYAMFQGKSASFFPKTVTTITKTSIVEHGFVISNGANFINAAYTNGAVVQNSTEGFDSATVWQLDESRHLFTYLDTNPNNIANNRDNDFIKYYLNSSSTGVLSLGTASGTEWIKNEDESHEGTLTCVINGVTWYLVYDNGWLTVPFGDTFTVANGNNFLGRNNSNINLVGTNANAANWHIENGRMMTYINNTVYYLNVSNAGVLSLGTTASTTSWAKNDEVLSLTLNGDTWYLKWSGDEWTVFPSLSSYTIHSGNDYFGITNNNLSAVDAENATEWIIDENKLYTPINGTKYYLVSPLNGLGDFSLSNNRNNGTDFNYTMNGGTMSYSANGRIWYLYSHNGVWVVFPAETAILISQNDQYLRATGATSIDGSTAANATLWLDDGVGHLYTFYDGANRYLVSTGVNVTLSNTASTIWTHNPDGTVSNGDGWYLVYDNGWNCYPSLNNILIHDGINYLRRNGTNVANGTSDNASRLFVDDHRLYAIDGTIRYYLRATNNALSFNTNYANGTEFTYDSSNEQLSFEVNNTINYVVFDGTNWTVSNTVLGSGPISSGNNYLNASTTTISRGTNANNATSWTYDQSSGKIYTKINNTNYYLRGLLANTQTRSTTNLTLTSNENDSGTTWEYTNNNLSCELIIDNQQVTYYLVLENNNWKLIDTNKNYYTINNRYENYLNVSDADNPSLTSSTDENTAVLWSFSNGTNPGYNASINTTVSTVVRGTTRYLAIGNTSAYLTNSNTLSQYYNYYDYYYYLRNNGYYLRYNDGWTSRGNRSNNDRITRTEISFTPASVTISGVPYTTQEILEITSANTVFTSLNALNSLEFVESSAGMEQTISNSSHSYKNLFTQKDYQVTTKRVTTEAGGYDTFFPLVADNAAPFDVNPKNTGYFVGGSHASYQENSGDVRFSSYYSFDRRLNNKPYFLQASVNGQAYTSGNMEVLTRTYLSNGFKRIIDSYNENNGSYYNTISSYSRVDRNTLGLVKYDSARSQLDDMFMLQDDGTRRTSYSGSIYGVHFMDAAISMDNMITAPKVVINGQTYYDYQMPEDSIDFRLKTKGFINFFAGTYYVNDGKENNCFFSLNQIVRNSNNEITAIKRITKIYGVPNNDKKPYIYLYGDGTYSSGTTSPVGTDGYIEMFDTDWIERPTNIVECAMYYFEIPVNAGEYALGSVEKQGSESARYGAYLCYLDIGTKAASHSAVLGTIDFVYDNLNNKIVVVPDTSDTDTSLNYYTPSLTVLYTKNTDEDNNVTIDSFTVAVTRTISGVNDSSATLNTTLDGDDSTHLNVVKQSNNGGDVLNTTVVSSP